MSRSILIGLILLALVGVAGLAIVATDNLLDARGLLAQQLSEASGRDVSIEGPIRLRPGLLPGLRLRGIRVGADDGASVLHSARAGRLDLVFALWPLLHGKLELHRVRIFDAKLVFEEKAESPETREEPDPGDALVLALVRVQVQNLEVDWHWNDDDSESTLARLEQLSFRDEDGRIDALAAGSLEGIPFDLSGHYAPADLQPRLAIQGRVAGAQISLEGDVVDGDRSGVELSFALEAPHLGIVGGTLGREWPEVGPVRGKGVLSLAPWKAGLSDLEVNVGHADSAWLKLKGYLKDLRGWRDYALHSDFGVADVGTLKPLVRDPPDIGTVTGTLNLSDVEGVHRIEKLEFKGGRSGVFEIDADLRFGDVQGVDDLDAKIDLKARDLSVLGELLHADLPPIGPAELTGDVVAKRGKAETRGLRARVGRNHLRGSATGTFSEARRPSLVANLETETLFLADIGIAPGTDSDVSHVLESLQSTEPLAWERLGIVDGRLRGRAHEVVGVDGKLLDDLRVEAKLEDRLLELDALRFLWEDGSVEGTLRLDARASPPAVAIDAQAKNMRLERLLAQIDDRKAWSGELDVMLNARAEGRSTHELASSLDGHVSAVCDGGMIDTDHASLLTRDLFRSLRGAFGKSHTEKLNCLVVDFDLERGVASVNTLLLDAADVVIVGEGQVDLGGGVWDLRLVPHPRDPGLLSAAAKVRVTGPLAEPRIQTVRGSLVTSATGAVVSNFARFSGVRHLWRRVTGHTSVSGPCDELLASIPR